MTTIMIATIMTTIMIAGESAGQNLESAGQSLQVKMSLQVKIAHASQPT